MMNIDGAQQRLLRDALLSAFPTRQDLEMMVTYGLYENLAAIVGDGSLEHMVFRLIQWAVARGKLEQLIMAALKENGDNPQLRSVAAQLLGNNQQATPGFGTHQAMPQNGGSSGVTPAQSYASLHNIEVPCSSCGRMNYFDKHIVCKEKGGWVYRGGGRSSGYERVLYLKCLCGKGMVVPVDCRGYE